MSSLFRKIDPVIGSKEHADALAAFDASLPADSAIGAKLAELLRLKRDPDHRDRWQTSWGSKTNAGLARSVIATIAETCGKEPDALHAFLESR
jgi:hypothetical protein